jgi:hypothetical protein
VVKVFVRLKKAIDDGGVDGNRTVLKRGLLMVDFPSQCLKLTLVGKASLKGKEPAGAKV